MEEERKEERKSRKMALCASRHTIPGVYSAVFPQTVNLSNLDEIDDYADRLACALAMDGNDLDLYVTGVQYPLVAVINACHRRKVRLTLWHFHPVTMDYYPQEVYDRDLEG